MMFRPMPILTILSIASLIILVMLGNWQYGRYSEKLHKGPEEAAAFRTVSVEIDTSNQGVSQQVYGIIDGEAVWRRYVPGRIDGDGPIVLMLLDATSGTEPVPIKIASLDNYERRSNVFVREVHSGGMTASNRPEENLWYTFDGTGMLTQLGYQPPGPPQVVESDIITLRLAEDTTRARKTENAYATPEVRDPLPPERHFGYALTWWGMALALMGVYFAFHHAQGRLRFKRQP